MKEIKNFDVELEVRSPLRMGGKKDPFSGIDQPVVRIGNKIVIPGTSLKGALRQEIEDYIIENYSQIPEMKPCIPSSEKTLSLDEEELIRKNIYKGPSCIYPRENTLICPVCYLLGAQGLIGFVTVPFLNSDIEIPSELYAIRIDRSKGIAAKGTNREYQIIPEGSIFKGVLQILIRDNVKNWELGKPRPLSDSTLGDKWLKISDWTKEKIIDELIIKRLENIKRLGSMKSAGAGEVKITVKEI
ncbi:hypothetical protein DRN69_00500 [Candidatus Pacearchaeota archaeon]|nr:MAG: hypothetical protein DRN69_00500 [Candidatus Pacearchaeota archaeon]